MRPSRPPLPDATADATADARAHLAAIAGAPRPAGGAAEASARAYCAALLSGAGFAVHEEPFAYSASVGRWAMPVAGAAIAASVCGGAALARSGRPGAALAVLLAVAGLVAAGARWATREGVLRLPTERRQATNLVATRGGETPSVWLVAHLDSKSQPVPMLARVVGVAGTSAAWFAAVALAAAALAGLRVEGGAWTGLSLAAAVLALPVVGSVVGARSAGALDNASGVVTVLLAATATLDPPLPGSVGVLVTSAEELGLAGARAWARSAVGQAVVRAAHGAPVAINVDGVDDAGPLAVLVAGSAGRRLDAALAAEPAVAVRRVPPGVLVDAIALADAGFEALTVSKGTLRTLARIHTPRDSLAALSGAGIPEAARLVRRLAAAVAAETP